MAADNRWLVRQRQTWYAIVEVPPSLRAILGRRIKRTLKTRDIHVARARRHQAIATIHWMIEQARNAAPGGDPLMQEADAYREALQAAQSGQTVVKVGATFDPWGHHMPVPTQEEFLMEQVAGRAAELHHDGSPGLAGAFYGVATGTATPIRHYVETWLSEGGVKGSLGEKTKGEYRKEIDRFAEWLEREKLPATIEGVTRRVVGRYVSEVLLLAGLVATTNKKKISAMSSYWTWLRRRGHLSDDGARSPWEDQSPAKGTAPGQDGEGERPFTDEEVKRLLCGPAESPLPDFMRVAALTGMRREEIGRLRVSDCVGGSFRVRGTKSAAARRTVPIHPDLDGIVAARCKDKSPEAYLFHDLEAKGSNRTDPIGKSFTRYRRSLGIQDGEQRRSLVNFHSWRRWFVTKARAKADLATVQAIVGHRPDNLTDGTYSGGPTEKAKKACVRAVRLPA